MSFDTAQRFDDDFQTNIIDANPNEYDVVYASLNDGFDIDDFGAGPVVEVNLELDNDELFGTNTSESEYIEEGFIILSFYGEKGTGTREADTFYGRVRDQYRNTRLNPGVGEEGTIYIQEVSRTPRREISNPNSRLEWVRYDIFLSYIKNYDV